MWVCWTCQTTFQKPLATLMTHPFKINNYRNDYVDGDFEFATEWKHDYDTDTWTNSESSTFVGGNVIFALISFSQCLSLSGSPNCFSSTVESAKNSTEYPVYSENLIKSLFFYFGKIKKLDRFRAIAII